MFKATFEFTCSICGHTETKPRNFENELWVNREGQGSFNLKPFHSWRLMELCFDRYYEKQGPLHSNMLSFKYAVCSDNCKRRLDCVLALIHEKFWDQLHDELEQAVKDEQSSRKFSNEIARVNNGNY